MKKITFILLALISGTVFGQDSNAASATGTASAEIIKPITIAKTTDLVFGRLIGDAQGGDVVVAAADGARTAANTDLLDPSSNIATAAAFTINAAMGTNYNIVIVNTGTIDNGTETMALSLAPMIGGSTDISSILGTGEDQTLSVGGVLSLGTNQAEGDYSGDFTVTVTYE